MKLTGLAPDGGTFTPARGLTADMAPSPMRLFSITFTPARGLTAEAGYGLSQFGNRFTGTPNIGYALRP